MRTLIALCREAAATWWRELPPLVRSRQFLYTTLLLVCVGLLMAFTHIAGGTRTHPGAMPAFAAAPAQVAPAGMPLAA